MKNLKCVGYVGPFVPGQVVPPHAVPNASWQLSLGQMIETDEKCTVDVPELAPAPATADAAVVQNAQLRAALTDASSRVASAQQRAEEESNAHLKTLDEKAEVEKQLEAAKAAAADAAQKYENLRMQVELQGPR